MKRRMSGGWFARAGECDEESRRGVSGTYVVRKIVGIGFLFLGVALADRRAVGYVEERELALMKRRVDGLVKMAKAYPTETHAFEAGGLRSDPSSPIDVTYRRSGKVAILSLTLPCVGFNSVELTGPSHRGQSTFGETRYHFGIPAAGLE